MSPLVVVIACVALLLCSALVSALVGSRHKPSVAIATSGSTLACSLGTIASISALLRANSSSLRIAWTLPVGSFHIGLDPLTSYFLFVLFLVSGLTSLYASGYLAAHAGQRGQAAQLSFLQLLLASMALLLLARDGVLFLMAWETMSIASYFLVASNHQDSEVARAGLVYLVASHLGTLCLFVAFAVLAQKTGSSDFTVWAQSKVKLATSANVLFVLALLGFGTKAGLFPVHVWLPLAHPAAPSPVSALMSGVMIKMGVYGLLRVLTLLTPAPTLWGELLVGVGIVSGLLGAVLSLTQRDLKRVLAYSSVENMGIIVTGLGIGVLGQSLGYPKVAFLGFAGALLHVLNHALFKSLLFQTVGNVLLATGRRDINDLGGLSKYMPVTSFLFLLGTLCLCGLPCTNGFIGEWLLYVGAFRGTAGPAPKFAVVFLAALVALALMGGLALAGFVKAYGLVFLGKPRSSAVPAAHEVRVTMTGPIGVAAALCVGIGMAPNVVMRVVTPAASSLTASASPDPMVMPMLDSITRVALALVAVATSLFIVRRLLLRNRLVTESATWGCGYARPTARMQYTSASFVAPALFVFRPLVAAQSKGKLPTKFFEQAGAYDETYADIVSDRGLLPAAARFVRGAQRLRVLQHGRVQLYLVYVMATLIGMLVWQLATTGR